MNYHSISTSKEELLFRHLHTRFSNLEQVNILDTQSIKNYEVVYLELVDCDMEAIAIFAKRNEKYQLRNCFLTEQLIERAHDIYIKHIDLLGDSNTAIPYLLILNCNPNLAYIELTINAHQNQKIEVVQTSSIILFELPTEDSNIEYNFYDFSHMKIK